MIKTNNDIVAKNMNKMKTPIIVFIDKLMHSSSFISPITFTNGFYSALNKFASRVHLSYTPFSNKIKILTI